MTDDITQRILDFKITSRDDANTLRDLYTSGAPGVANPAIVTELDNWPVIEWSDAHNIVLELRAVCDCPALQNLAAGLFWLQVMYDEQCIHRSEI
jgi:hypothetical protein